MPNGKDSMSKLVLHPKAAASGLSGSLALIVLWAISHYVKVPSEVAASFAVVLSFAGSYLAPWLPVRPGAKPPAASSADAPKT